jgi:hypothetical protein
MIGMEINSLPAPRERGNISLPMGPPVLTVDNDKRQINTKRG